MLPAPDKWQLALLPSSLIMTVLFTCPLVFFFEGHLPLSHDNDCFALDTVSRLLIPVWLELFPRLTKSLMKIQYLGNIAWAGLFVSDVIQTPVMDPCEEWLVRLIGFRQYSYISKLSFVTGVGS